VRLTFERSASIVTDINRQAAKGSRDFKSTNY
jgi:hypothetical protein